MEVISSKQTNFLSKILPYLILIILFVGLILWRFFSIEFNLILFIFFICFIFSFSWFRKFKNLKEVKLGKSFLVVDNLKINFSDIEKIERNISRNLTTVSYRINENLCFFIFRPNSFFTETPLYYREICQIIKSKKIK